MQAIKCDSKGRLYLKESLRKRYGDIFIAVPVPGEIVLIPVPSDALRDLREATKKLRVLAERTRPCARGRIDFSSRTGTAGPAGGAVTPSPRDHRTRESAGLGS